MNCQQCNGSLISKRCSTKFCSGTCRSAAYKVRKRAEREAQSLAPADGAQATAGAHRRLQRPSFAAEYWDTRAALGLSQEEMKAVIGDAVYAREPSPWMRAVLVYLSRAAPRMKKGQAREMIIRSGPVVLLGHLLTLGAQ